MEEVGFMVHEGDDAVADLQEPVRTDVLVMIRKV